MNSLASLSEIKKDLTDQAKVLLKGTTKLNGVVEIGYPGRFVPGIKTFCEVLGDIVAVYEMQRASDRVETGLRRSYHKFAQLDYSEPNLHTLPDDSADVITCYVGLHHFQPHKLHYFLKDIRRVLRPGGHFLLVDHDITNDSDKTMAYGAHIIFNAVNGVTLHDELNELRCFNSMEHWKEMCKKAGLDYEVSGADVEMIRPGDPSRNRMVCFSRPKLELVAQKETTPFRNSPPTPQDWRKPAMVKASSSPNVLFSPPNPGVAQLKVDSGAGVAPPSEDLDAGIVPLTESDNSSMCL